MTKSYYINYYDEYLEIDDFTTIESDQDKESVKDEFYQQYDEERYNIQDVSLAYEINEESIEELGG